MKTSMKYLFFVVSIFIANTAWADSYISCNVSSEHDFSVKFTINDNGDDLYVKNARHRHVERLWSAEHQGSIIYDHLIKEDETYYLALDYEYSGNTEAPSIVTYYKSRDNINWYEFEKKEVNFHAKLGLNMKIFAEEDEDIISLSCSNSSFNPIPDINYNPQFEFGRLSPSECPIDDNGNVNCTLTFKNEYDPNKPLPLVFVMPTIDLENSEKSSSITELPSSLKVTDVTHENVKITQVIAPNNKKSKRVTFKPAPMTEIDYFVIEPGVLELTNGSKIVANSLFTSTTISQGDSEGNTGDVINFTQYGLSSNFTELPGVLVEPQTENNSMAWVTGYAGDVGVDQFRLALERSEVRNHNVISNNEKVAFVAGEGAGFVNGKKFWLGQAETKNTIKGETDKIVNPVIKGCTSAYTDISEGNFDSPPILVATKNSRNGGNGGWLRRCDLQKDKVSFIVEEDMDKDSERAHAAEKAGFFMFEEPRVSPVCDLFPSPVQTWKGNRLSSLSLLKRAKITGTPLVSGRRLVGFLDNSINDDNNKIACDGSECFSEQGLMVDKLTLESFRPPTQEFEQEIVGKDENKTYGSNEIMGSLTIDKKGKAIFETGTYWIDSINVIGELIIPPGENVTIHTKGFSLSNSAFFGIQDNAQLLVIVHDLPYSYGNIFSWVNLANHSNFKGLLYSEKEVLINNHAVLTGAVTASVVTVYHDAQIVGSNQCFDPPKNYTLKVTPQIDYSLICERIPVTFTVEDDNGPVSGFNKPFSAVINAKDNGAACWSTFENKSVAADCSITGSTFVNGKKILYLGSSDLDVFDVTASSDGLNETTKEHFEFVPFKFNVNTVKVIANKPQSFDVSVLACNDGSPDVVQDYSGNKELDVSPYILDVPNSYEGIRTDLELAGKINPNQIGLTFNQGIATTDLTYSEAGAINFTLSDPSFTCPVGFDCNDYPVDSGLLLSAVVNIESRPWKLVVCSDKAIDGDSSGGSAFIAAGERFSVKVKPVRFGTATDLCQLPVTQNFFKSSAPFSSISPSYELSTPTAGVKGTLAPLAPINNDVYVDVGRDSYYEFNNMTYSEVGSLLFKSEALSPIFYDGIQGGIEFGELSIGRFYPAYFTITDTLWDYPKRQGSSEGTYAYMDQPFEDVTFEVTAYSAHGSTATNYGLFDTNLKASFELTGDYHERLNIAPSDLDNTHWSNATWETPNLSNSVIWSRKSASMLASNVTTTADGPFNEGVNSITTALSLAISGTDPVFFDKNQTVVDQKLLSQPDVRYGRMVLDSVGAAVGQSVMIPLRVEYWNGTGFVISDSDNATTFNGANYCKQTIWPEPSSSSNSALSGSNLSGIDSGIDRRNLKAIADTNNATLREQVRFWLRLASISPQVGKANVDCSEEPSSSQPWLQYNWRGKGDEDPSTVVTFGIYRGNDRIIFRGESNIIGTSN
ncbi:DUF6701 domain-containing protein [Aliivibrio logei]|uniref:DUF6701 domain-containing protein n=1 Tax=Aliivibrio logei 5S-186 TaxID=626086 RepID=A0ABX3B2E9_ALILO|nr:DUF6701 domain-containing protein [Aliivibrio logei]OEF22906.1 hypothetical protein A1Q5_00595 [Aliivibrio logei 5S-186]